MSSARVFAAVDCGAPVNREGFRFSDEARDTRDEFYADMCRESDVLLVIASDPNMKSRLQVPSKGHRSTADDIYPENQNA
jgi:hypothetical protein